MSLITWKEEFYPVKPSLKMTKVQAIEHSLKKWEGLTRTNLKKHGLYITKYGHNLSDDIENFIISSDSCALCHKYLYEQPEGNPEDCAVCPLYATLGKGCGDGDENDPYTYWSKGCDPKPMIKALKKCLKQNT